MSPFAVNGVGMEICAIMEPETWWSGQGRVFLKQTERNANWQGRKKGGGSFSKKCWLPAMILGGHRECKECKSDLPSHHLEQLLSQPHPAQQLLFLCSWGGRDTVHMMSLIN